ncbi:hypothetical protein B0A58_10065, partial [Flavobacterium branchiophilum NBRC 15030 = ATCC 35035]|uniref:hypothetical protein n=1 Tax=Flavobacterium branchiophilum TaxID=55197 RepID=UPI000B669939
KTIDWATLYVHLGINTTFAWLIYLSSYKYNLFYRQCFDFLKNVSSELNSTFANGVPFYSYFIVKYLLELLHALNCQIAVKLMIYN